MISKDQKTKTAELQGWMENIIREFCGNSPDNSMNMEESEPAVDEPLVGFSNGGDPLYIELQKDIGSPFMTPMEIFEKSFPGTDASR